MKSVVRRGSLLACITILSLAGLAAAQGKRARREAVPQPVPRQGAVAPSPHRGQIDMYLAEGVALDNDNEIAIAKVAQTRASSKDVVKFAEQMEKDHGQFANDLEKYTGPLENSQPRGNATEGDGARIEREPANNAAPPRAAAPRTAPAQPGNAQPGSVRTQPAPQYDRLAEAFVQIHQEIAKECRESAQHELESKKGAEFDKCYMGMQLAAHMKMVDVLKVFERHASPELARVFANGRETAQKHFDRAMEIMKDLDGDKGRETAASDKSSDK